MTRDAEAGRPDATRMPGGDGKTILRLCVILAALAAVAGGLLIHPIAHAPTADLWRLALAVAVAAVALIARIRVRVSGSYVSLAWGEAALIVALYLVPAGWVPLAMLVGVVLAMLLLRFAHEVRTPLLILFNAASLALAAAVAAAVAEVVDPPHRARVAPPVVAALVLAAVAYSIVCIVLLAATVRTGSGTSRLALAFRTAAGKVYMVVGNITVGVIIVVMIGADRRWLFALPPVLWLLRQAYGYRVRSDGERHGWKLFAAATQALNRLDEFDAVSAAIPGAARLFYAETVEVTIRRPDGTVHDYHGGAEGPVRAGRAADASDTDSVASRQLLVGESEIGELRLRFARPVGLTRREGMQLSAFCDALAAALHDAASHQQLLALSARSSHEALRDPLTAIGNRSALLSRGQAALADLPPDAPVALLLLDIDRFKEVNDTLGHAAGDDLLRVTAQRIDAARRAGEVVARTGGDEFALLLTELPVPVGDEPAAAVRYALRRARELADLLATPTQVAGVRLVVEASVGVAVEPAGGCEVRELIRRAELAMYQAKDAAGGIASYDSAGDASTTDRLALLADLREALNSSDQLTLALQPMIDLATGWPTGVEALVRWRHPRRGELHPLEFIDVVENSELVAPFTGYVIDRALGLAAQWASQGLALPVSVNLSPRSLLDPALPDLIGELLHRHAVPASRLILEITETVVVPESRMVTAVLAALRDLGVQLAVDDFGTGYSSLTFLTRVRVDEVKVDRSFVSRMAESPEATAIVQTIVELARQLRLRVVAEGVETAEQRAVLTRLGCDSAQGYHFFRPMPPEKIVGVLHQLISASGGRIIPFRQEGAS